MTDQRLCVIVIGGAGAPTSPPPMADLVIAADSGVHLAAEMGLHIDLVVGDFDSSEPAAVARAVEAGAAIETHPAEKDATDLELALTAAGRAGATRTIVLGGGGWDRIDHVLANATAIAAERHAAIGPEWWVATSVVLPTRGERILDGDPGDTVSILPIGGPVEVSTHGLRWELDHATIPFGSARGISNQFTHTPARVTVHAGTALIIQTKEPR